MMPFMATTATTTYTATAAMTRWTAATVTTP